jgi:TPR repeat protein
MEHCIRITRLASLVLVVLAATVPSTGVSARTRATVIAQVQMPSPKQEHIDARPATVPYIESAPATTPSIDPRPLDDQPSIVAPPVTKDSLTARDTQQAQAVDRELRRLLRTAEAPRTIGSTMQSAQAAWTLGLIYLHGAGVRRDTALAQRWFEQAARFGREPWAYAGLAWCYLDGCKGPPDPVAAARAIDQLRPHHAARADFLQWVLAKRQTPLQVAKPGMNQDQVLDLPNRPLLERAAAAGDMHANIELGMDAVTNGRIEQAEQYFRRAGTQSQAAEENLQQLAARGNSPITEPQKSPLTASAAEALATARRYHRGQGVPSNFTEAIRFYRLADQRGSVEARRMLALIYSRPAPGGSIDPAWMQQLAQVDTATTIPTMGVLGTTHLLHREPTPLYDLMPVFWRDQLTQVGR